MIISRNIWIIRLELNWMLQLSGFIWTLRSSVFFVFNNFLQLFYVSNESKRICQQHCILSSTTLHSRSVPLKRIFGTIKALHPLGLILAIFRSSKQCKSESLVLKSYFVPWKLSRGFIPLKIGSQQEIVNSVQETEIEGEAVKDFQLIASEIAVLM